ncbi:MAG: altronate dehydratase [Rhodobacteraceae bacterium]|nr:altronate dehydratase [Paracoccaceae bacterium]
MPAALATRLHPDDNVLIALADLAAGATAEGFPGPLPGPVPRGHKLAAQAIAPGERVIRYGQTIGAATAAIAAGAHVHSHNLGMSGHDGGGVPGSALRPLPSPPGPERQFQGYHRADGRVGTRNFLGVLTSVNCSGSVARFIAEAAEAAPWRSAFANVDGIVPIVHGSGCGMAGAGAGFDLLLRTLKGWARNPNFGGILLVGLGCEVLQLADLVAGARLRADDNFRTMTIQATGGTRATVERGTALLAEMAARADRARRAPAPVSALTVALQCGGSDGYSGITANPALGAASDLIVARGGTTILSETPEIYGAEHLLTARAADPAVARRLIDRIRWWEAYVAREGGAMDNNPSPGNKRGGLTTILEKSLGAVAKGGTAPLAAVCGYGEEVTAKGLVFMDTPGYDPCSVTGQVAGGANLVVFTTGRGSVSGFKPVPCIKLATNSEMHARMAGDMDLDCGDIVERGVPVAAKGAEIFELILRVASGERTKSEALGFGGVEFVPWQIGAVM